MRNTSRMLPRFLGAIMLMLISACAQTAAVPPVQVTPPPTQTARIATQVVTRVVTQVVTQVVVATPKPESTVAPDLTATETAVVQATAAQATTVVEPTVAATPTATVVAPTAAPQPTLSPDMGQITNGGNLRETPGGAVIGQVCPGDTVSYLHAQGVWYTIRIEQVVADCVANRVKVGNIGWVHQSLLTAPQVAVPTTTPEPTPEVQALNQTQRIGPIRTAYSNESYTSEITLLEVRWSQGGTFSQAGKGKVYALVSMRIKNLGPSTQRNVSAMMFKALDVRGALNDAKLFGVSGEDCAMEWVDLSLGGTIEGCIAFEVPDSGKLNLIYAPYLLENLQPGRYLSFKLRP